MIFVGRDNVFRCFVLSIDLQVEKTRVLRSGLHLKHHLKFEYLQILPDCHLDCGLRH